MGKFSKMTRLLPSMHVIIATFAGQLPFLGREEVDVGDEGSDEVGDEGGVEEGNDGG
jgi:hypothetical protein